MIYNVRMYDNPKDLGSDYSGILFENVTEQGVIEIVQFALAYGKAVSAVVSPSLEPDNNPNDNDPNDNAPGDIDACSKDACDI